MADTQETVRSETAALLAELKTQMENRDAEYKRHGEMLGETDAKFDQINDKLADVAQLKDRLETLETRANAPENAEDRKTDEEKAVEIKAAWNTYARTGDNTQIKALSAGSDTAGGYLVMPGEFVTDMLKSSWDEMSPIRQHCTVRQTTKQSVMYPVRTGVYSATKVSEIASRSETTGLTFGLEEIPHHEVYARVDVSQQELEDSAFDMEALLADEAGIQFGVFEGTECTTGNGQGGPMGFVTTLTAASAYTALGTADAIDNLDGLIDLQHDIKSFYMNGAVWAMNRGTIGAIRKAKGGDGQYLWEPAAQAADPFTFLGNKIVEWPGMADIAANAYAVAFGNFRRGFVLVDRIGLEMLRDPYSNKPYVEFLFRKRLGGQVVVQEALRLGKVATS